MTAWTTSGGSETVLQVRPILLLPWAPWLWVLATCTAVVEDFVLAGLWCGTLPLDRNAAIGIVTGLVLVVVLFLRGMLKLELFSGVDLNRWTVLFRMRDLMVTRLSAWATDSIRMLLCALKSSSIQYVGLVVFYRGWKLFLHEWSNTV